jgi:hypothetical protein
MDIKLHLGDAWIPAIYSTKIRPQRTRAVDLDIPERENQTEILYTLLGIELKIAKRRIACPDLATARYLRVFARIGCRRIAVPYDISRISLLADELETAWQNTLLLLGDTSARARSNLIKSMRTEINEIGPGNAMPEFRQSTRQKKN